MHRSHPILATLLLLTSAAQAQVTWPRYSIGVKLKAVPGFLGFAQPSVAKAINNSGHVVGWTTKSAGSVTRIGIDDAVWQNLGLPIGVPTVSSVPMTDTYPVLWTAGAPKVQARYKTNYSTWGLGIQHDGTMLVSVAPVAGRLPRVYAQYELVNDAPLPNSTVYALKNGQYTAVGTAFKPGAPLFVSNTGAAAGYVNTPYRAVFVDKGRSQDINLPPDLANSQLRGLSDTGVVLLAANLADAVLPERCVTWYQGQLTELMPPTAGDRIDCRAINASGVVAGFLTRPVPGSLYEVATAVFVVKNGQFSVSPFEIFRGDSVLKNKLRINAAGTVLYDRGWAMQSDGSYRGGGVLFADGQTVGLDTLLTPALPKSQYTNVRDFNDVGQVLAEIIGAPGSPPVILSPVKN